MMAIEIKITALLKLMDPMLTEDDIIEIIREAIYDSPHIREIQIIDYDIQF